MHTSYFSFGEYAMMKFDDKEFIAEKIKFYRKKAGYTQSELSEMVDITDQHLSRIESGCYVPSLKTFFMLVYVLKIDLREFGFDVSSTTDPLRNKIINEINSASETELLLYTNMIPAIKASVMNILKKKLLV